MHMMLFVIGSTLLTLSQNSSFLGLAKGIPAAIATALGGALLLVTKGENVPGIRSIVTRRPKVPNVPITPES